MNINDYIPAITAAEMFVKIPAVMIVNLNGVEDFFSINQVPQIDQISNVHVPQKAGGEAIDLNVNPRCTIMWVLLAPPSDILGSVDCSAV